METTSRNPPTAPGSDSPGLVPRSRAKDPIRWESAPGNPALEVGGERRRNKVWIVQSQELAYGKFLPSSRVSDPKCRIPFSQTGCIRGIPNHTVTPLYAVLLFPFLMGIMPTMPQGLSDRTRRFAGYKLPQSQNSKCVWWRSHMFYASIPTINNKYNFL